MHHELIRRVLPDLVRDPTPIPPGQLPLPFYGKTINVDGMKDPECDQITYWGQATCVFDDIYQCYATVGGTVCIVDITVRRKP